MRIATWNLNSIRARHARLFALLERHRPDVLCLQELKVEASGFPSVEIRAAGYHAVVLGQKTYNGVAILSRTPPEDVREGLSDDVPDPQARLVSARIEGIRVLSAYVPNGGEVGSEKWAYKIAWLRRLRSLLEREHGPGEPLVLAGDFNVAPTDLDVKSPERWAQSVLAHPEARAALDDVRAFGLVDTLRHLQPDTPNLYSWWDYRNLGFAKNDGLRIDHVDVTRALLPRVRQVWIDRDERKGAQPSDHAPVVCDLA